MEQKEIYNLLDSGWIYCVPPDQYYERSFFRHIPPKEKIRFGKGYFVKKSKVLYERLVALGLPKDSESYDSCIVLFMEIRENKGVFNLMSLKQSGDMEKSLNNVVKNIMSDQL